MLCSKSQRYKDMSPHDLGVEGEKIAANFLKSRGLEILKRNWVCPCGEADIIAREGDVHVLVEVKTRLMDQICTPPYPELAVNSAKRRKYQGIARCYLANADADSIRFDIVAITISDGGIVHVRHIVSAFGSDA